MTCETRLVWAGIVYMHIRCRTSQILTVLSSLPVAIRYLRPNKLTVPLKPLITTTWSNVQQVDTHVVIRMLEKVMLWSCFYWNLLV